MIKKQSKINSVRRTLPVCFLLLVLILSGCHMPTHAPEHIPTLPIVEVPGSNPAMPVPTLPAFTPTPTTPPERIQLTATVWESLPRAPVLMYHRFDPRAGAFSSRYVTSLTDFDQHLYALHEAGFSLVSLNSWLRGVIHLQEGRRPLIITIDDLFYADQISLDDAGNPALYSGLGRLWSFSQEYPDFNFAAALFFNLGDKGYLNDYTNGVFSIKEGWREARARAIAWCIENGATPMNHLYEHPFLNRISPSEIQYQLEENDRALRQALTSINREDLIPGLPNVIALPYVVWPETDAGKQVLYNYTNPEGAPVAAIIEGDYDGGTRLAQAPFADDYSRWHIPRITASSSAIEGIISRKDDIPAAKACDLGEVWLNPHLLPEAISTAILARVMEGSCPDGYYIVHQWVFFVQENEVIQFSP